MKNSKITKFVLAPAFILALTSCGGNPSAAPTLKDISVVPSTTVYTVGYSIDKPDFAVTAKYSDNTTKVLKSDEFTVDVTLPHTFKDEETVDGKDFNITYKEVTSKVHVGVESADGKSQITFKNYDGSILQNTRIEKGQQMTYKGVLPRKPAQGKEIANIFKGWDKDLGVVTQNTVLTAQYTPLDNYVDNDHDGLPEGIDLNDHDGHFNTVANSFVKIDQDINIDFTKFLVKDANMKYDNDLAKLGLFMSNPKIDFDDGLFERDVCGGGENALYARLGLDDFHHFDFKDDAAKNYKYDSYDTTSGVYGHKYLTDNNNQVVKDLIILAFEGTNGKNRWASNFDVGYHDDKNTYYEKVANTEKGEKGTKEDHPEWDDKDFHKGFYIAAHRVLNEKVDGGEKDGPVQFLKYIEEHTTKDLGKPIVFVTGHSRGGAMANIVGEYLENRYKDGATQEQKCIPFTYAFAAPSAWGGNKSKPETSTVFNVINEDDFVTKVPFIEWGFTRLGDDEVSVSAGTYKSQYDEGNERKYQWIDGKTIESIFHNVGCNGRAEIYDLNNEDKYISNTALNEEAYVDEASAKKAIEELEKTYSENLGDFFKFVKLEAVKEYNYLTSENEYNIYANACLGTVTALIGRLMTSDEKVMEHIGEILPLIENSKFTEMLLSLAIQILPEGTDKIALPHDYGAYHIILRNYTEPTK